MYPGRTWREFAVIPVTLVESIFQPRLVLSNRAMIDASPCLSPVNHSSKNWLVWLYPRPRPGFDNRVLEAPHIP